MTAHYVTMIDLTIELDTREGRRIVWFPRFRIVDTADVEPDPEVLAAVRGFEAELSKEFDVGRSRRPTSQLDSRTATVRTGEAAIGNLYRRRDPRDDAVREIAIINGGGLRGEKIYPPGSAITRRDVLAGIAVRQSCRGACDFAAKTCARQSRTASACCRALAGRFPQVSGMSYEADLSRPPGQRVLSIRVGDAPLDEAKIYRLATNDFMARGGDGYTMFRDAKPLVPSVDGPLMANEVMVYLRKLGTVKTGDRGTDRVEAVTVRTQSPLHARERCDRRESGARFRGRTPDAMTAARSAIPARRRRRIHIEADLAFDAQRLQRDGVVRAAIHHIGADADADSAPPVDARVIAGEIAKADLLGRREHAPGQRPTPP